MAGTSEGGRKAAETRGHDSLSKAGQKGGEHSHGSKGESHQGKRESEEGRSSGKTGASSSSKDM